MNEAVSHLWQHPKYRWHKKRFLLEDHNAGSNVRVQRMAFLLCIRGRPPGWNIGSEALSRDRGSVWFSSVRPAKYWDNTLNYALRDSSHHSTLYQLCGSENAVQTNDQLAQWSSPLTNTAAHDSTYILLTSSTFIVRVSGWTINGQ